MKLWSSLCRGLCCAAAADKETPSEEQDAQHVSKAPPRPRSKGGVLAQREKSLTYSSATTASSSGDIGGAAREGHKEEHGRQRALGCSELEAQAQSHSSEKHASATAMREQSDNTVDAPPAAAASMDAVELAASGHHKSLLAEAEDMAARQKEDDIGRFTDLRHTSCGMPSDNEAVVTRMMQFDRTASEGNRATMMMLLDVLNSSAAPSVGHTSRVNEIMESTDSPVAAAGRFDSHPAEAETP